MRIVDAEIQDLEEILKLQYLAYQSEAKLHNSDRIPPLLQTLKDIENEYHTGLILKGVDENNKIIGSVRGSVEGNTLYIGKLIVHPDYQRRGYGKQLLTAIEQRYPRLRYELFTSSKSLYNLCFYEKQGYKRFEEKQPSPELIIIYLEKNENI